MTASKILRESKRKKSSHKRRRQRLQRFQQLESRQLLASLAGEVWADVNGNGLQEILEGPAANVRVYIDADDNGQLDPAESFTTTDALGRYAFNNLQAGTHVVRLETGVDEVQTSPRIYLGTAEEPGTGASQLFSMSENGQVNLLGQPAATNIDDVIRTNSGAVIGINSESNSIYQLDPITGAETLLASHSQDLVAGLAYDRIGDRIFTLGRASAASGLQQLYEVDPASGGISVLGSGIPGLSSITDLTFDTPNNRVVGFNDFTDQFFAFTPSGIGSLLATADRSLDSLSLAHNGFSFVMFDAGAATGDAIITVNPDTGATSSFVSASQELMVEGLSFSTQGDAPYRVTVGDFDDLSGLDFGMRSLTDQTPASVFDGMFINELFLGSTIVVPSTEQLIELRGAPRTLIPSGTYFVVIEDDNGLNNGEVANVFDLSNQAFGENGMLVIASDNFTENIDPLANALVSAGNHFAGLPGNVYQGSSDMIDLAGGAHSFMLVTSDIPPQVGDDIDGDNNGVADGVYSGWTVHDSVSMHSVSNFGHLAYGDIVFARHITGVTPNVIIPNGANLVLSEGYGYLARMGDSVGSDPEDWLVSSVSPTSTPFANSSYRLPNFDTVRPSQTIMIGRELDHFGESNFVGGVRGTVIREPMAGDPDTLPQPAEGVTVFLDVNNNNNRDNLLYTVEPNDFFAGTELTNEYPGVTLNVTTSATNFPSFNVTSGFESFLLTQPTSNRIFYHEGVDFFFDARRFRADFYRPVNAVSITAIGSGSTLTDTYIRINAYDRDGNLLQTNVSGGAARQSATTTVDQPSD